MQPKKQIIIPRIGWQSINVHEFILYRDLLYFMVLRQIKVLYKQSVLGFTWALIRPLFSMIIFSVVFGELAKIPSDGIPYPIFSYAALVPWTYFSTAMVSSTQSLIGGAGTFTKVYFPRLFIPLTPVIAGLIDFLISLLLLFILMVHYGISPTPYVVFLPVLIIIMVLTSAGVGMWLSALAIQYRDVKHAIGFFAQLLMYLAPVVWPVSLMYEKYGETLTFVYSFYPMAGVIEGFRAALLGTTVFPMAYIITGASTALFIFISGAFYFNKKEKYFADVA